MLVELGHDLGRLDRHSLWLACGVGLCLERLDIYFLYGMLVKLGYVLERLDRHSVWHACGVGLCFGKTTKIFSIACLWSWVKLGRLERHAVWHACEVGLCFGETR